MAVLVTSMGAVGDGKTDSSSDFQRAIDSLPQEGEVLVPAGTYIIKNVQLRSKIRLAGEGKASILKLPPSSRVWDMLFITGGNTAGEQIDIAHLTLDGSRDLIGLSDVQMHGIDIRSGSKQVTVTGITAQNMCGDGIRTTHDGQLGTVPSRIQIEQCFFTGIGRQDIAVIQGYDLIIQECCGTGTLDIEPEDPLIKRIAITGCDFKKLVISANDREQTADIVVTGCTIQESTVWNARGVNMGSNEIKHLRVSTAQDITLSGNSFRMLELYPTSDQTCTNVVVTGNLIQNITDAEGIPLGEHQETPELPSICGKQ
ncbi:glycosyl hydrolase family 28-related protein [Paenibacillus larvae]|uniref:glycosyl hydrolase family 28-related protein n=1 Tax=Paenibacillus larvae TaxID=1464 RepID=UPI0028910D40|nr:glycosyl hydrolase family 28-related protein [Paenibacillus larvae]MDT2194684.1 glycosyl hydrolase family 28-related protein [Paenibacillus larvae]MDT2254628.1 glycosyl hydrolase family 28-related protein [Paenibacillus larvae]